MARHNKPRPRVPAGHAERAPSYTSTPDDLSSKPPPKPWKRIPVPNFQQRSTHSPKPPSINTDVTNSQSDTSEALTQRCYQPSRRYVGPQQQYRPNGEQNPPRGPKAMARNQNNPSTRPYHAEWKTWPTVTVKLTLPKSYFDFAVIYSLVAQYASVTRIDLVKASGYAYVELFPAPQKAFWKDGALPVPDSAVASVPVALMDYRGPGYVPSPFDSNMKLQAYTTLYGESLDFGVMTSSTCMMQMKSIKSTATKRGIAFQTKVDRQEIEIRFNVAELQAPGDLVEASDFCFTIPFRNLEAIQEYKLGPRTTAFLFTVATPPEFYKKVREVNSETRPRNRIWSEWRDGAWARQTEIMLPHHTTNSSKSPIRFQNENALIDCGRWLTYQFVFKHGDGKVYRALQQMKFILETFNVKFVPKSASNLITIPRSECKVWKVLELSEAGPAAVQSLSSCHGLDEMQSGMRHFSFPILYQLNVCISSGQLNEHSLSDEFLQKLSEMDESLALHILENVAESRTRHYDPMEIFKTPVHKRKRRKIPSYATQKRSLSLTPTSFKVWAPTVETSNRMERKWWKIQDRFLRVRFVDEDYGRINSRSDDAEGQIFNRIQRALEHGIILGDRHYQFLGFGNSQFREHSAYFFAPIKGLANWPDISTADMRDCMGNLSHIRNPAKFAARLGQNFSTTRALGTAVTPKYNINDIEAGDKCIFSDGVGMMSSFVAQLIAIELGLSNHADDPPSVVQFRLGGCKGVLAISPETQGREVLIRPSQKKFDSENLGLEVIRTAQFVSATLNRQLILILSSGGVENGVFKEMVRDVLDDLARAMNDATSALRLLQRNVDINQMTFNLAAMVQDGFMDSKEPFVMSILRLWRAWTIKYIKEKAKIPFSEGACLLGCVDEYGVLKGHFDNQQQFLGEKLPENRIPALPEVFIQVDPERKGNYRVIEGICLVARNPSLHPGDVRVVHAVNKPELQHLRNCIVFPQNGDRDVPSMCSGGDLDGDDYLIIWKKQLFPGEWNHPPMDFTAKTSSSLERDVKIIDVISFFTQYMKNDQLRPIATAHLIWADRSAKGVKDERCLELAGLHSDAVDYPKSGVPVKMAPELRAPKRPHFLANKYAHKPNKVYRSTGILGQLYDMIEPVQFNPEYGMEFDIRILNSFALDDSVLQKAADIKRLWDQSIKRIMILLGIESDFEVFSCFVMAHNETKKDYSLAEELGQDVQGLKTQFRELCAEVAGGRSYDVLGRFIVAAYNVTAREVENALKERSVKKNALDEDNETLHHDSPADMPMMSFPWIFQKELGVIAKGLHHDAPDISVNFHQIKAGFPIEEPQDNIVSGTLAQQDLVSQDTVDLLSGHVPLTVARDLCIPVQSTTSIEIDPLNNLFPDGSSSSTSRTPTPSSSISTLEDIFLHGKPCSEAQTETAIEPSNHPKSSLDLEVFEEGFEIEDYEIEDDDDDEEPNSLALATERLRTLNQS